eukprot:3814626-Prymnesium_polylepis.1
MPYHPPAERSQSIGCTQCACTRMPRCGLSRTHTGLTPSLGRMTRKRMRQSELDPIGRLDRAADNRAPDPRPAGSGPRMIHRHAHTLKAYPDVD